MNNQKSKEEADVKMRGVTTKPVADSNQVSAKRSVGFITLAYVISMMAQNVLFGSSGAPSYSDPLSLVLTYHAENQGALGIMMGLEATNMVLLLLFLTTLHGLVKRRGEKGEVWA